MNYSDFKISKVNLLQKDLYCRGNFKKSIFKKTIAIVGSRRMTRYGREVVDLFVSEFVAQGITTISGFMYGVDTEVHQKTLDYGGITIAVFGCGLNTVYPSENDKLYTNILEHEGLVLSEYEPNAKSHLWKYPQRNKIVAGLSTLGVLVIEAGKDSGSLITADLAYHLGKKVYAVPGPITSSVSEGTNWLIKNDLATLVTTPSDILNKKLKSKKISQSNLSPDEQKIIIILKRESLNSDELSVQTGINIVSLTQTLSLMSLKGLILESSGKYYITKM